MPLFPPPAILSPRASLELSNMSHKIQFTTPAPRTFTGVKTHLQNFMRNIWIAGASKNTSIYAGHGAAGSQNAGLVFSGYISAVSAVAERYNGNTWTATGSLVTAKDYTGGAGTVFAACCFGGFTTVAISTVEVFNSATWAASAGGNLTATRYAIAACGTRYSAVIGGGHTGSAVTGLVDLWNGEYAVAGNILPGARYAGGMAGTRFNAMYTTGSTTTGAAGVDNRAWLFNGTNWTVTTLNHTTARYFHSFIGSTSGALMCGGDDSAGAKLASVEIFNLTSKSFKETSNSLTARSGAYAFGTGNAATHVAGHNGTNHIATSEKWYGEQPFKISIYAIGSSEEKIDTVDYFGTDQVNLPCMTEACDVQIDFSPDPNMGINAEQRADIIDLDRLEFTEGTWNRDANLNTARVNPSCFGIRDAAVAAGGFISGATAVCEKYNGSTWTAGTNINTARTRAAMAGMSQSGLIAGGDATNALSSTETYDGTTWTTHGASLNTAIHAQGCAGTKNAAVTFSGADDANAQSAICETFNGSTWTSLGAISSARYYLAGAGTKYAAISMDGYLTGAGTTCAFSQKFNGAVFQSVMNTNFSKYIVAGCGSQNNAMVWGGSGDLATNERFNGDSWRIAGNMIAGRTGPGGTGAGHSAISCVGQAAAVNQVESDIYKTKLVMPFTGTWGKLIYDI